MKFIVRHLKIVVTLLFIVIIVSGFTLLNPFQEKPVVKTNFLLNTLVSIKAYGKNAQEAADAAMDRIREIEDAMSAHAEGSEIWHVNRQGHREHVKVSKDTLEVIQRGLYYSRITAGYFDITVKPLVDVWQIGTEQPRVPSADEIKHAIGKIGYQKVAIDEEQQLVKLDLQGMGIDLGGIAKGYAADEVLRVLKEHGIQRAYADLGGNVVVLGQKKREWGQYIISRLNRQKGPPQRYWRIGIQDPVKGRGLHMAVVEVADQAVVTSGPYERNFQQDGKVYHHILNPFTGYPAESSLISATVIAEKSMDADALSTSIFLLGEKEGLRLIESQPGIEAMIINKDKIVSVTKGLEGKVEIVDQTYRLKSGE